MKTLIMAIAMVATALGTALGLAMLFPKVTPPPDPATLPFPLERVIGAPLAPAPVPPGNALSPFTEQEILLEDESAALGEDLDSDLTLSAEEEVVDLEALYQSTLAELDAPVDTADADGPAEAIEVAAAPTPTATLRPAPTAAAVASTPAPTAVAAATAPTRAPVPRTTPAPRPASRAAAAPPPPAVAWWETPRSDNGLGIVYVGSAAYRRAIVLMANGSFNSADSANRHISVQQGGQAVSGRWAVAEQNTNMLIFPVDRAGTFDVAIGPDLQDSRNRRFGASRSGAVMVR